MNPNLPTGEIEVRAGEVTVQSAAAELPMPVFGEQEYPEEIRLKYRYLDLRREQVHANIMLRSAVIASIRRRMIDQGFTEFQTPILTASSPEGARDYLVPSRVHPGKFYALPQAPQMFKQLIMVAGFDRYFQIAPCFRDEDARADRSPGEFYQLDFEMSFVTQDDVFAAIEPVLSGVFEEFANGRTVTPAGEYPRIPYKEALLKYGTDKPDLRNPLLISDVGEHFKGSGFGLFAGIVEKGGVVRAVPAPGTAEKSRKFFDDMNEWARSEGFAGLGYATRKGGEWGGPIAKNHGEEGMNRARRRAWASAPTTASSSPPARKPKRRSSPAPRAPASPSSSTSSRRARSASAGSSTSRCSSITRSRRRSTSATTPSRCRRARWRRWRARTRSTSSPGSMTSSATAWS